MHRPDLFILEGIESMVSIVLRSLIENDQ
jgi:hypothetical protein